MTEGGSAGAHTHARGGCVADLYASPRRCDLLPLRDLRDLPALITASRRERETKVYLDGTPARALAGKPERARREAAEDRGRRDQQRRRGGEDVDDDVDWATEVPRQSWLSSPPPRGSSRPKKRRTKESARGELFPEFLATLEKLLPWSSSASRRSSSRTRNFFRDESWRTPLDSMGTSRIPPEAWRFQEIRGKHSAWTIQENDLFVYWQEE